MPTVNVPAKQLNHLSCIGPNGRRIMATYSAIVHAEVGEKQEELSCVPGTLAFAGPALATVSWAGLDGCGAKHFGQVPGFLTDLMVQLVTQDRRLPVHVFACTHQVA